MVLRQVPGRSESDALAVTPAEVAAARLAVKRAEQRGAEVDDAVRAIAAAAPLSALNGQHPDAGGR